MLKSIFLGHREFFADLAIAKTRQLTDVAAEELGA